MKTKFDLMKIKRVENRARFLFLSLSLSLDFALVSTLNIIIGKIEGKKVSTLQSLLLGNE